MLKVSTSLEKDLVIQAVVRGVPVQLLIDSRMSVLLMTFHEFKCYFGKQRALSRTFIDLWNFTKEQINILCCFQASVQVFQLSCSVLYVINKGTLLVGVDAI